MNRLLATCFAIAALLTSLLCLPATAAAATSMPTAGQIDAYLGGKGSPMTGQGSAFVASGGRWQIDPRLLVAIAGAESSFGGITCAPFNAWGWGCPNGPYRFESWADGIDTVAKGLRTNYLSEGRTSVALIHQKYAPVAAANDPTGLNNYWTVNVSRFLVELGGDPGDVDLAGVGGTRLLGTVTEPQAAGGFQFAEEDSASAADRARPLVVAAGDPRPLLVRVRNTGSTAWRPQDVRLRRVDLEPAVGGAPYGSLEVSRQVPAGAVAVFRVDLAARGARGGSAVTRWRLEGPGGLFGPEIVRVVRFEVPAFVAGESSYTVTAANGGVAGGAAATVVVRVRNAGSSSWERDGDGGVLLGLRSRSGAVLPGEGWVNEQVAARMLQRTAAPGEVATFTFRIRGGAGTLVLQPFTTAGWAAGSAVEVRVDEALRAAG